MGPSSNRIGSRERNVFGVKFFLNSMNRSKDWQKQAKRDLERALLDYEHQYYEWCCFTCQQAAEKSLKALFYKSNKHVKGHSIAKMLESLKETGEISDELIHWGRILDRYYMETRYPNGFPEGSPYEYFDEKIAEEALHACREIQGFSDNQIDQL